MLAKFFLYIFSSKASKSTSSLKVLFTILLDNIVYTQQLINRNCITFKGFNSYNNYTTGSSANLKNIKEDKLKAIFKAYSKIVKNKANKVNKTELSRLLVKEVIKIGLFIGFILQKPITAILKLDFKAINLLNKLIFAAQCTNKPINSLNVNIKFNNLFN